MKLIKDKVIELLEANPMYRDDDNKLIARIWFNECESYGCQTHTDLLKLLATGKLTFPESIRRSRQKVQEEMPSLRGLKYKARHEEAEEVKKDLGYN